MIKEDQLPDRIYYTNMLPESPSWYPKLGIMEFKAVNQYITKLISCIRNTTYIVHTFL